MKINKCFLQTDYPSMAYRTPSGLPKGATVSSGGCGMVSVLNIMYNYVEKTSITITQMRDLAVNSGARYNGGTDIKTLLNACRSKWGGFTFEYTTSDSAMKAHVSKGGCAVMHTSGSTPLFSRSGHFVAACGISGGKIQVMDSFYYPGKWTENSTRKSHITTTSTKGVVYADYTTVAAACDYYYLVTKIAPKVTITDNVTARIAAGKSNDAVGIIYKGVTLEQLSDTDNWVQTVVWIAKKYCSIKNGKATAKDSVNFRASNGSDSVKLGVCAKGDTFSILEETDNWVKTSVWIAKKYIK